MATKAYVVSEGSFSYDDNYYSLSVGGHPTKVFLELDQAEEYSNSLSLTRFKDLVLEGEIFNYGYGEVDVVFDCSDEFEEFISIKFKMKIGDWWSRSSKYIPSSSDEDEGEEVEMSDDDWKKFHNFCTLGFTFIQEVEFGDVFS